MILVLSPLEKAIAQLEEALDLYDSDLVQRHPRFRKHLRAAAIQAFEFTYELSFKMIKRWLKSISANPAEVDTLTFKNIIREAISQELLTSEPSDWVTYRRNRRTTSHTYDETKAERVFESIPRFLDEARYLLNQLHKKTGSLE